jgi:hypothetical protein
MLAITGDDLDKEIGKETVCPNCTEIHEVKWGKEIIDGNEVETKMLGFVTCGTKQFLVAVNGKLYMAMTLGRIGRNEM